MELEIDVMGHHLTHEGKLPEAQEYLIGGREPIYETPTDYIKREQLLERMLKVEDRTLRTLPLPAINTSPAALVYRAGLSLWGVSAIIGDGLFGGYSLMNLGAAAVEAIIFDGADASGTPIAQEVLTSIGTLGSSVQRTPSIPWKIDNGLFIGFAGTAANVALVLGSLYMIRE